MRFGHCAWCGRTEEYGKLQRVKGLMAHPGGCAKKVQQGRIAQVRLPGTKVMYLRKIG